MGWSYSAKAGDTMSKWEAVCRESCGSSNTWKAKDGVEYFFEPNGREYADGSIVGAVYAVAPCRRVAGFRINPDGSSDGLRFMRGSAVAAPAPAPKPFSVDRIESDEGEGSMVVVRWGLFRNGRAERTFNDEGAARVEAARLNSKYAKVSA